MPHKDPEARKAYHRAKYQAKKHLWKNPDGTWKKSNVPVEVIREQKRAWYRTEKGQASHRRKRAEATARRRAERDRPCEIPACKAVGVVWDHSHATGAFRGWICSACNLALGHARDSPDILRALAEYLERAG